MYVYNGELLYTTKMVLMWKLLEESGGHGIIVSEDPFNLHDAEQNTQESQNAWPLKN